MSTPFHRLTSKSAADGTVETQNGSHVLRFERYLPHSIERVWAAITEPEQLVAWLAEARVDPRKGGAFNCAGLTPMSMGTPPMSL